MQDAWAARTARVADDEAKAVGALDGATEMELKKVAASFGNLAAAAARQLTADRRTATRAADLERGRVERATRKGLLRARLDLDRRIRLADSDYFTLKIRAVAFLQDPSAFTSVSAAYDPATDPGSLYNVARRIGAADLPGTATGRGVDVALIDTGVVDVPGLAASDVEIGPDFSFEDVVPDLRGRDTMGHGTHLAGIIAGRDAAWVAGDHQRRPDRFLGIAPDAGLVSVKAGAADGAVDVTQIIAAINWVIANKDTDGRHIRVLNLSFGTDGTQDYRSDPLAYAVERAWRAGIVVVVAGGNDGWSTSRLTNPAQDPFVLAVGSSQAVNGKESVPSSYSNGTLDGRAVDLAAPGRSIVSLRNPGSSSDEVNAGGRTGDTLVRASGTSQAAAVTSGAAALLLSARPELTPDQVKQVLMQSADSAERGVRPGRCGLPAGRPGREEGRRVGHPELAAVRRQRVHGRRPRLGPGRSGRARARGRARRVRPQLGRGEVVRGLVVRGEVVGRRLDRREVVRREVVRRPLVRHVVDRGEVVQRLLVRREVVRREVVGRHLVRRQVVRGEVERRRLVRRRLGRRALGRRGGGCRAGHPGGRDAGHGGLRIRRGKAPPSTAVGSNFSGRPRRGSVGGSG